MTERCPVHHRPLVETTHAVGAVCPACRASRQPDGEGVRRGEHE